MNTGSSSSSMRRRPPGPCRLMSKRWGSTSWPSRATNPFRPAGNGRSLYPARAGGADPPPHDGRNGSRSEFEEQPDFLPDKFEAGTPNTIGLAGLGAGVAWILARGVESIRAHEEALTGRFIRGLREIPGIDLYGPADPSQRTAIVSFNIDGLMPSEAAQELDERFAIMSRPGLHCAPAAHRTIGTFPRGTVRFGFGLFNTEAEIDAALEAVRITGPREIETQRRLWAA